MAIVCKNTSQYHFIFLCYFCLCSCWNGFLNPVLSYANWYFPQVWEPLWLLPFLLARFALLFVVASARCYGASALFFRCVRNTFLMASVRGNKNYDLPIVSGRLRMSGRIHGQSLASTRPMLQAWVSTCNFRYVLRKRHWHHHSSPTTSQITKCQSASFTRCLFVSFSHHCPNSSTPFLHTLVHVAFRGRSLSSLSPHEAAEIWRSVGIPLMVPHYKKVGNGLKCRVNPGQIMPIDHCELFLQKIKWSARDNLLLHLILLR